MADEAWTLDNITLDQINQVNHNTVGHFAINDTVNLVLSDHPKDEYNAVYKTGGSLIQVAFKKTKEWADLKEGELMLVTEDLYDKALQFCEYSFCKDEPLSKSLNVDFTEDAEDIWKAAFMCQMSLMIQDQSNGEVMGMRTIRIARDSERFEVEQLSDEKLRTLFGFMQYCNDHSKFFDHYKTDSAVHFLGLGVAEKYRGRGLGTKLVEIGLEFVRNLDIDPVYIKAEGTSNYSQKIFEKLKFEKLYEQKYEEYLVEDKVVIRKVDDHESIICYGKKLSNN